MLTRRARPTPTAVDMVHGETLEAALPEGSVVSIKLLDTRAEIVRTTLKEPGMEESGAVAGCA